MSPNSIGSNTTEIRYAFYITTDGIATARELMVNHSQWWDKVFEKDYKLMPIKELENFIEEHKHLPDIPSEKEMLSEPKGVGEMSGLLLKKIEELTLYIVEQNKKLEEQQVEIDTLKMFVK
jgi:hypothetical protein